MSASGREIAQRLAAPFCLPTVLRMVTVLVDGAHQPPPAGGVDGGDDGVAPRFSRAASPTASTVEAARHSIDAVAATLRRIANRYAESRICPMLSRFTPSCVPMDQLLCLPAAVDVVEGLLLEEGSARGRIGPRSPR